MQNRDGDTDSSFEEFYYERTLSYGAAGAWKDVGQGSFCCCCF